MKYRRKGTYKLKARRLAVEGVDALAAVKAGRVVVLVRGRSLPGWHGPRQHPQVRVALAPLRPRAW